MPCFSIQISEKVKADEKLSLFRKKKHDDSPNRSLGWRSCCSNPVSIFSDSVLLSDSNRTRRLHAAAYYDGDTVLVNKLDYRIGSPKRLDAVILELENGSTTHYSVKRVVGLPGETIKIENGKIYINNKELKGFSEEDILSAGLAAYDVELGEDEYFVMGDNCNNSEDSRVSNIGNIKRSQFVGKIAGTLHKVTRQ